jgi:uncharacterized membrane protein YqaE (UPF0057 family)
MNPFRLTVCLFCPPLAVIDKGVGTMLRALLATVLGLWYGGVIYALQHCGNPLPAEAGTGNGPSQPQSADSKEPNSGSAPANGTPADHLGPAGSAAQIPGFRLQRTLLLAGLLIPGIVAFAGLFSVPNQVIHSRWADASLSMVPVFPIIDDGNGQLALVNEYDLGIIAPRPLFLETFAGHTSLRRTQHRLFGWESLLASFSARPLTASQSEFGFLIDELSTWQETHGTSASASRGFFAEFLTLKSAPDAEVSLKINNIPGRDVPRRQLRFTPQTIAGLVAQKPAPEHIKIGGGHRFDALKLPDGDTAILIRTLYQARSSNAWNAVVARYSEQGIVEILLQAALVQDVSWQTDDQGRAIRLTMKHAPHRAGFSAQSIWDWNPAHRCFQPRQERDFPVPFSHNAFLLLALAAPFPLYLLFRARAEALLHPTGRNVADTTVAETTVAQTMWAGAPLPVMLLSVGLTVAGFLHEPLRIFWQEPIGFVGLFPLALLFWLDRSRALSLIVILSALQACALLFDAVKCLAFFRAVPPPHENEAAGPP